MVTEAEVSSPYRYSNNCGQGLEVKVSSKFQVLIGILTIAGRFSDWLAEVQVSSPYRYSNNECVCYVIVHINAGFKSL